MLPESAIKALYYRSLVVPGVEHDTVLQAIKDSFLRVLVEQLSYKDFKEDIDKIFDANEVSKLDDDNMEAIFRTNIASLYSEGELSQIREMPDAFPMWRYSAIKDKYTRSTHWHFNGKIWRTGDGPIPPIDVNCRCSAIYLHKSEVAGLYPKVYNPNSYLDPKTGTPVDRFDNRTAFSARWIEQQRASSLPDIRSWINERLNKQ